MTHISIISSKLSISISTVLERIKPYHKPEYEEIPHQIRWLTQGRLFFHHLKQKFLFIKLFYLTSYFYSAESLCVALIVFVYCDARSLILKYFLIKFYIPSFYPIINSIVGFCQLFKSILNLHLLLRRQLISIRNHIRMVFLR